MLYSHDLIDIFVAFPQEIVAAHRSLFVRYADLLSPREREQEERFVFERDRQCHRVTRALLRTILGEEVGVAPQAIAFEHNAYGRPALAATHGRPEISFNVSHTREVIVLAVARDCIVGIDVENRRREGATVEIADRFFSPREVALLRATPSEAQKDRFYRIWTLKEAYIKARGMGLSLPLDSFGFTFPDGAAPALWTAPVCGDEIRDWHFRLFAPSADHYAALAVGHPKDPLTLRVFSTIPLGARKLVEDIDGYWTESDR